MIADRDRWDADLCRGSIGSYLGMKVYIRPAVFVHRLSWTQRLFSWPWRPWCAEVRTPNPIFANGEVYRVENAFFMTQESWDNLQRQLDMLDASQEDERMMPPIPDQWVP